MDRSRSRAWTRLVAVIIAASTLITEAPRPLLGRQFQGASTSRAGGFTIVPGAAADPERFARFTRDQLLVLEMLNRADAARLPSLAVLVVPEAWHHDPVAYIPFPADYAWGSDEPTLLVVDQPAQAFAGYEYGQPSHVPSRIVDSPKLRTSGTRATCVV